jgi:hypothetical protein
VTTPTQDTERSYLTAVAESTLPNSRRVIAGAGITLTDSGAGSTLEIAADPASATGRWEPVTNSDPASPEILFSDGDVVVSFVED